MDIYNNKYESAIRILSILNEFERELQLQELIYFDYIVIHGKEVSDKAVNIYPNNPRHNNWQSCFRRNLIQESLILLIKKNLVQIICSEQGLKYRKNDISNDFLECFRSEYYLLIKSNSKIIAKKFENMTLDKLEEYVKKILTIKNEANNYDKEFLLRGGYYEI